METKAVTKTEADGQHPASHYLVVEDPEKPSTWHLRVRGTDGKPDHRLMGAAWAALHGGYRGNKYEGPQKQDAIAKLTKLYGSEDMLVPGKALGTLEYSNPSPIEEIKSLNDDWEVLGYVSTFNNMDLGRDIVVPGAFAKSLKVRPKVPFLRDHDQRLVLGVSLSLKEDTKGLFGRFKISKTKLGEETHELIKDGALDSFSFGYMMQDYDIDRKKSIRYLKDVNLYETTLLSVPMNPLATVTSYKDYLSSLGIKSDITLAEKTRIYSDAVFNLSNDYWELVNSVDRPLSECKRQELSELLELCSGWDAVRSELQKILTAAPTNLATPINYKEKIEEIRKKHNFTQE